MLHVNNLSKDFTLFNGGDFNHGEAKIPVFRNINFKLLPGDCVALVGESGSGKSTFMRMIYANYLCSNGSINIKHGDQWFDLVTASPHQILKIRSLSLGYVSQFLRVIPRVPTLEIVAEPLTRLGTNKDEALEKAKSLLERLRIPSHLWNLSPLTFSGGEQQRVNIARGFIHDYPIMLLDEPTASLDAQNRQTVLELIEEAKTNGAAILGIFHDHEARDAVCNRILDVTDYRAN
ncbi:MAG: phosphonate C-P lyase system protein PhnL [Alphaproteobacteria bacterium]|nr:phosphonate C-P lyase system protein PhnL [Alphaproteobacteria bacterium]